jgi:hypothetical protein
VLDGSVCRLWASITVQVDDVVWDGGGCRGHATRGDTLPQYVESRSVERRKQACLFQGGGRLIFSPVEQRVFRTGDASLRAALPHPNFEALPLGRRHVRSTDRRGRALATRIGHQDFTMQELCFSGSS